MNATKVRSIMFFALMGIAGLMLLFILKPFFYALFWASVIASVFRPLFCKINRKLNRPDVSSSIVIVVILLIIFLPAAIISSLVIAESIDIYNSIDSSSPTLESSLKNTFNQFTHNPYIQKLNIKEKVWIDKMAEATKAVANYLLGSLKGLTENALTFFVQFGVMLYALYFFVRDGNRFLQAIMRFFPLGNGREHILYEKFKVTAWATLKVTMIIGGIQGVLGGLIFFLTGIKGALTWAIIMVMTSIIPSVGCAIVWLPAAVIMIILGHIWEGIIILAFGTFVISMVDHFLRPVLLGKDVELHPLTIFLSTLGGIMLFGISGFVIGPIVASLFLSILEMYEQYYQSDITG
jgi:predicted PurR-regulated permease PerM